MIAVNLTPEQIGFLRAVLEHVRAENVPADKPNILEQSFRNGIDSILAQLP